MSSSRPTRLRLNVKMDLDSGVEIKKRKVVSSVGSSTSNCNGLNSSSPASNSTRTSNIIGTRTRGMAELTETGSDHDSIKNSLDNNSLTRDNKHNSSSDSSSSDSSDSSDSEDSSDMDKDECERKVSDRIADLSELEKQFAYLRELDFREKMTEIHTKLKEIKNGTASEFLAQLQQLKESMNCRIEVAKALRDLRLSNLECKKDAENVSAAQTFQSEKSLLKDSIKQSLENKIHLLEQDRNNDFSSELWLETVLKRKNSTHSKDIFGEKKKKPAIVSGPYIVYMLHDVDIIEDWTAIKKAAAAPRRKPFVGGESVLAY